MKKLGLVLSFLLGVGCLVAGENLKTFQDEEVRVGFKQKTDLTHYLLVQKCKNKILAILT